jgi:hypothetical protein
MFPLQPADGDRCGHVPYTELLELGDELLKRVGPAGDPDDEVKLESALLALIDRIRPDVSDTLVKGFGNESTLFLSIWRASEGGAIDEPEEDSDSVLNGVSLEKMKAFEWITEGMPSLKRE